MRDVKKASAAASGPSDAAYLDEITMMMRDQLRQVIKLREPKVLAIIDEPANAVEIRRIWSSTRCRSSVYGCSS